LRKRAGVYSASLPQDQLARLVAALPPRALKEAVIDAIRDDGEFMARLAALVARG